MKPHSNVYTFGDHDRAAERLRRLAELYRPALVELVQRHAPPAPQHVLDLGCGPGHTTRALQVLLAPPRLTGIDSSARFLEQARRESPPGVEYVLHDVSASLPPLPEVDLAYSRFVLTHLASPATALSAWAAALRPGARLLLQETATLASDHPALARYYELVSELQRRHGQALDVGRRLVDLVDERRYRVLHSAARKLELPAAAMASLHASNLVTWRTDTRAWDFDAAELDRLSEELALLAAGEREARIEYAMGELVLERR